ncbi:MAG: hypothetical protein HOV80_18825 [Polyangiaceae bacterium]|nr:hypothetical protein [Polyangiaceae bacterium]
MSFAGWCNGHVCVTAAAASLELFEASQARSYLRQAQLPSGAWGAYWWTDDEYATALAIEGLATGSEPEDDLRRARADAWARRLPETTSAFALSHRIRIVLAGANPERSAWLSRALPALVRLQDIDGGFPASAWLRIPAPHVVDPSTEPQWARNGRGGNSINLDTSRFFTTASVVAALARAGVHAS